jgi:quercetin dioxygenase-like cupin family protein
VSLKYFLLILIAGFLASCQTSRWSVISKNANLTKVEWTQEELKQEVIVRNLEITPHASHHIIRLNKNERPHIHETHDLVVFVLEGEALFHLEDNKVIPVRKGDVISVPRGVSHWAELIQERPVVGYAVFTPALEGPDTKFRDESRWTGFILRNFKSNQSSPP